MQQNNFTNFSVHPAANSGAAIQFTHIEAMISLITSLKSRPPSQDLKPPHSKRKQQYSNASSSPTFNVSPSSTLSMYHLPPNFQCINFLHFPCIIFHFNASSSTPSTAATTV
jgi:hypothetical protein